MRCSEIARALVLVTAFLIVEADVSAAGDQATRFDVEPIEVAGLPGRFAVVTGVTEPRGHSLRFPPLGIFEAAVLSIAGGRPGAPIEVEIYGKEDGSDAPSRRFVVESELAELAFRTEGELQVVLRATAGSAAYQVAFWASAPMVEDLPKVLVPVGHYEAGTPDDRSSLAWAFWPLCASTIAVGLVCIQRRRRA